MLLILWWVLFANLDLFLDWFRIFLLALFRVHGLFYNFGTLFLVPDIILQMARRCFIFELGWITIYLSIAAIILLIDLELSLVPQLTSATAFVRVLLIWKIMCLYWWRDHLFRAFCFYCESNRSLIRRFWLNEAYKQNFKGWRVINQL